MLKEIIDVSKADLTQLGKVYHLDRAANSGAGWESTITPDTPVRENWKIGFVRSIQLPVSVDKMERHLTTKEAMMAASDDIVVALAPASGEKADDAPDMKKLICVLLKPGDVLVVKKGVWHSACYGYNHPAMYYFMFEDLNEPVIWTKIIDGPCEIRL